MAHSAPPAKTSRSVTGMPASATISLTARSGRYLDTPEFRPFHEVGNNERFFDRVDFQASAQDTVHLDFFLERSWFQIPNTFDQRLAVLDQRQQVKPSTSRRAGHVCSVPQWS